MNAHNIGRVAEQFVSPEWCEAVNKDFEQAPDAYLDHKAEAELVLVEAIGSEKIEAQADWEARRIVALKSLDGTEFGLFAAYMHARGGSHKSSELTREDLSDGEPGPVRTNHIIQRLSAVHEEPIDFLDDALVAIDDRRKTGEEAIGPENYATALKYFTDKYIDFPSEHLDRDYIAELVGKMCSGFTAVAAKDAPNFLEMNNIYFALRSLPKGSFPDAFTKTVVQHSLEQLPSYHKRMSHTFYGGISKLPNTEATPEVATLLDLSMRHFGSFETTKDMKLALRAIGNLPKGPETDRAFSTFLELRNNLEEPLDLAGAEEMNEGLLHVVSSVLDDLELILIAKDIATITAQRAVMYYKRAEAIGDHSPTQLQRMRQAMFNIASCAANI